MTASKVAEQACGNRNACALGDMDENTLMVIKRLQGAAFIGLKYAHFLEMPIPLGRKRPEYLLPLIVWEMPQ